MVETVVRLLGVAKRFQKLHAIVGISLSLLGIALALASAGVGSPALASLPRLMAGAVVTSGGFVVLVIGSQVSRPAWVVLVPSMAISGVALGLTADLFKPTPPEQLEPAPLTELNGNARSQLEAEVVSILMLGGPARKDNVLACARDVASGGLVQQVVAVPANDRWSLSLALPVTRDRQQFLFYAVQADRLPHGWCADVPRPPASAPHALLVNVHATRVEIDLYRVFGPMVTLAGRVLNPTPACQVIAFRLEQGSLHRLGTAPIKPDGGGFELTVAGRPDYSLAGGRFELAVAACAQPATDAALGELISARLAVQQTVDLAAGRVAIDRVDGRPLRGGSRFLSSGKTHAVEGHAELLATENLFLTATYLDGGTQIGRQVIAVPHQAGRFHVSVAAGSGHHVELALSCTRNAPLGSGQ